MVSNEAWQWINEGTAKSNGYDTKIISTPMKGKGEVEVHHVFKNTKTFFNRFKNALKKNADRSPDKRNSAEFQKLNKIFTKGKGFGFNGFKGFVDIVKLATTQMDALKNVQELQSKHTTDKNKKSSEANRQKSGVSELADDDDDNFEYSSDEEEEETLKYNTFL